MNYVKGNLWNFHGANAPVCFTTNGMIKKNGELVMGKGIALQTKQRYPDVPLRLGQAVKAWGNQPFYFRDHNIISFPTKHDWRQPSDFDLIRESTINLRILTDYYSFGAVYLTPPGCGNGGLNWNEVEPVISPILDERFYIVLQ